jgi:hypothetical protein
MNSVKRHEDKEIRGRILKILDFQYPGALSAQMLNYGLKAARYDCESTLKAHLAYLTEKGYVAVDSVGFADLDLKRDMVRLTALGKDLAEGNVAADPGVIIYG